MEGRGGGNRRPCFAAGQVTGSGGKNWIHDNTVRRGEEEELDHMHLGGAVRLSRSSLPPSHPSTPSVSSPFFQGTFLLLLLRAEGPSPPSPPLPKQELVLPRLPERRDSVQCTFSKRGVAPSKITLLSGEGYFLRVRWWWW